jgi:hypothetical protein
MPIRMAILTIMFNLHAENAIDSQMGSIHQVIHCSTVLAKRGVLWSSSQAIAVTSSDEVMARILRPSFKG